MRSSVVLPAVLLALLLIGCGGDDETTSIPAGPSGTSGPQGASGGGGMTAKQYGAASIPAQLAAVQDAADANPDCSGTNTNAGSSFQVDVSIQAANSDPDTPLAQIVANNC